MGGQLTLCSRRAGRQVKTNPSPPLSFAQTLGQSTGVLSYQSSRVHVGAMPKLRAGAPSCTCFASGSHAPAATARVSETPPLARTVSAASLVLTFSILCADAQPTDAFPSAGRQSKQRPYTSTTRSSYHQLSHVYFPLLPHPSSQPVFYTTLPHVFGSTVPDCSNDGRLKSAFRALPESSRESTQSR